MSDLETRIEAAKQTLADCGRQIAQSGRELEATVTELHREPRAAVELTEAELDALLRPDHDLHDPRVIEARRRAEDKLEQALAIERNPGGAFYRPPRGAA